MLKERKYIISFCKRNNKDDISSGGAATKAPRDVETLAEKSGYEKILISDNVYKNVIFRSLNIIWCLIHVAFNLKRHTKVIFQYPAVSPYLMPIFLPFFKNCHLILIIHDINSIRTSGKLSRLEQFCMSFFDDIIVHSDMMKNCLKAKLPKSKYHILNYFPYLAEPEDVKRKYGLDVTFAGNLYKSPSIIEYFDHIKDIRLLLYVKKRDYVEFNERTIYKGLFSPDSIKGIEGNWGLMWDGDSINTCEGNIGLYTKMNAPHKVSLYTVAKLPIIIWEGAAAADLVRKERIGITISSLMQIEPTLLAITEEQYNEYSNNIAKFSQKVCSGENLLRILSEIK